MIDCLYCKNACSFGLSCANFGLQGFSVLELGRGTRQTDRRTNTSLRFIMPPPMDVGGLLSSGGQDTWERGQRFMRPRTRPRPKPLRLRSRFYYC